MQSAREGSTTTQRGRWGAQRLPEVAADGGGQPAHAPLDKDVGEGVSAALGEDLVHHHTVAPHHDRRGPGIFAVRSVRGQEPSVCGGVLGAPADGVVVSAGDPVDQRPVAGDRVLALLADVRVQVDPAAATEHLRPPGHRAPVIAVGRTGHGQPGEDLAMAPGQQVAGAHVAPPRGGEPLLKHAQHHASAAQRLEAVQSQTLVLVLVQHAAKLQAAGKPVERDQRGRPIAGPSGEFGAGGGHVVAVDDRGLRRPVGAIGPRADVPHVAGREAGRFHECPRGSARERRPARTGPAAGRPYSRLARRSNQWSRSVICSRLRTKSRMKVLRNCSMCMSSGRTA